VTPLRTYLVILVGFVLGAALVLNALRQRSSLHPLDTLARLLLGASLLLLALFEMAGRTVWADTHVAPAWAAPAGVAILLILLVSGLMAGAFALHRSRDRQAI